MYKDLATLVEHFTIELLGDLAELDATDDLTPEKRERLKEKLVANTIARTSRLTKQHITNAMASLA